LRQRGKTRRNQGGGTFPDAKSLATGWALGMTKEEKMEGTTQSRPARRKEKNQQVLKTNFRRRRLAGSFRSANKKKRGGKKEKRNYTPNRSQGLDGKWGKKGEKPALVDPETRGKEKMQMGGDHGKIRQKGGKVKKRVS